MGGIETWEIQDLHMVTCYWFSLNDLSPRLKLCRTKDNLRISKVAHASMAQRAEHQIQMAEVLGSMLAMVTFCYWIFCFHIIKCLMLILPCCQFCVFVKNSIDDNGNLKSFQHTVFNPVFTCILCLQFHFLIVITERDNCNSYEYHPTEFNHDFYFVHFLLQLLHVFPNCTHFRK